MHTSFYENHGTRKCLHALQQNASIIAHCYVPASRSNVHPSFIYNSCHVLVLYMVYRTFGPTRHTGLGDRYTSSKGRNCLGRLPPIRFPVIHMLMAMLRTDSSCLLSRVSLDHLLRPCWCLDVHGLPTAFADELPTPLAFFSASTSQRPSMRLKHHMFFRARLPVLLYTVPPHRNRGTP